MPPPPDKIRSKDLSYDASLPPFLQRLRAANGGDGDQDGRHERPMARPKAVRKDGDDDGPIVVTENGDTLSKEEYAKLASGEDSTTAGQSGDAGGTTQKPRLERIDQKVADGTLPKKRKAGKVIGDQEEGAETGDAPDGSKKVITVKKPKKKAKPIKLAFDHGDEE
ncbi:hypothetical protein K431DRAFT_304375 [Polychaeton citri CBS 116435]|uniref:DUF4604 domain-containing protein n=1 Tax=Polychaeton citri CBS 116435 TaxID=1314669 RepID=A0A9P4UN70_9PEZI|nr:hypothetical protein K431DRAFT_304375 [Polychaeton citri CBS 116435]